MMPPELSVQALINGMGEIVTHRDRTLGARDSETGWPATTWTETDIKAFIRETGTLVRDTPAGRITEQRARMYTMTAIEMRDQITYGGHYWEVEDVQFYHSLLGVIAYYDATLIKLEASS